MLANPPIFDFGFRVNGPYNTCWEVSQTLQNSGPIDLTRLSLELAAREVAQTKLLDASGNPQVLDRLDLLPNATGMREIITPRGSYVSAIDAEEIGKAVMMIGGGRTTKEDVIDPAVGIIREVKSGEKVEAGAVLCHLYHTTETNLEEASELVEGAFRISSSAPEQRDIILEVVG